MAKPFEMGKIGLQLKWPVPADAYGHAVRLRWYAPEANMFRQSG
jgi:hypothetical protein